MKTLASATQTLLRLALGKRSASRIVVFESDDWGASRTLNGAASTRMRRSFGDSWSNPFYSIDSLESAEDLDQLFSLLSSIKDVHGAHPRITANTILANPDFGRISKSNFDAYYYERFTDTISRERGGETLKTWFAGVQQRLLVPQLHGREHLHALLWLAVLKKGNSPARSAFDEQIYHFPVNERQAYPKKNLSAALNISGLEGEKEFQIRYLEDAVKLFRAMFGSVSKTFIAPCYLWNSDHERILCKLGVRYLQGIGYQYVPLNINFYEKRFRYTGQTNEWRQRYFVRNCFFEPALNPSVDWVDRCLRQVSNAFRFGAPAIIGVHRVNFVGALRPDIRNRCNGLFKDLLTKMQRAWPDIQFSDTATLSELLFSSDNNDSLRRDVV